MSDRPHAQLEHIHLKVVDLEPAIRFHRDLLGFEVTQRHGDAAAFLCAGGCRHDIGLDAWESKERTPPAFGHTGLYHGAFFVSRPQGPGSGPQKASSRRCRAGRDADHGVSEAIYCRDPDFNGVEICRDRDPADWPRDAQDNLAMVNHRLDVDPSLAETD